MKMKDIYASPVFFGIRFVSQLLAPSFRANPFCIIVEAESVLFTRMGIDLEDSHMKAFGKVSVNTLADVHGGNH